jgi:hypothetical protein
VKGPLWPPAVKAKMLCQDAAHGPNVQLGAVLRFLGRWDPKGMKKA